MKVSIVIPNFNGATLLKKNLPSVNYAREVYKKKTGQKAEIIITDDASSDESKSVVASMSFPVHYIEHDENVGFSTNVNRGVAHAKGEILVLLNTDVLPEKNFLLSLVSHFSDERVFAVGCMDKSVERGREVLRGRGEGTWRRGFLVHRPGEITGKYTMWASGGSSAYRRSLWEKLGGMDELFNPFYWEDIDLSYRAWKAGYTILFDRESVVRHEHEEGSIRSNYEEKEVRNIAYRNQFIFVWKNAAMGMLFKHIGWLPYHITHAILQGDGSFFRGLFAAIALLPEVITHRKRQEKRVRSDTDITTIALS